MPSKKKSLNDASRLPDEGKASAKLRVVGNGSVIVNTVRAERASAISIRDKKLLREVPERRDPMARPISKKALPRGVKRGTLDRVARQVEANVFIQLLDPAQEAGKSILLTGDGHAADIRASLSDGGALDSEGRGHFAV